MFDEKLDRHLKIVPIRKCDNVPEMLDEVIASIRMLITKIETTNEMAQHFDERITNLEKRLNQLDESHEKR